jgi:hypothetical protein
MNASESVQDSVLFELSPPLPKNGKRGIGAFLQDILTDVPIDLRSRQQARALLLCAINSQLASRVLTDTKTGVLPLQPVRFRRTLLPHPRRIQPHLLTWAVPASLPIQPLPQTREFLESLPDSVISTVLDWAPPVVGPPDKNGRYLVVANHIPAMLAFHRLLGRPIRVRELAQSTTLTRSFAEICAGVEAVMGPVFALNRHRIVLAAGRLPESPWFSDYCRSWSAEVASRYRRRSQC